MAQSTNARYYNWNGSTQTIRQSKCSTPGENPKFHFKSKYTMWGTISWGRETKGKLRRENLEWIKGEWKLTYTVFLLPNPYFQTLSRTISNVTHTQIFWEVKNMCLSDSAVFWFYLFHDNIKFIFLCFCCLQFILLLNNGSRIKQFLLKSTIVFEVSYYGHYETPISWTDIPTYIRASAHSLSNHISPIKIYSCLCPMFSKFHFFWHNI